MFTVIIPAWEDAKCWQALRDSDFCRHHLLLPAGQHGYCEGAQHNRCASGGRRLRASIQSSPWHSSERVVDQLVDRVCATSLPIMHCTAC